MDIALLLEGSGETIIEVMARHTIDTTALARFNTDPVFLRKVNDLRGEVREKGMTFRMKARAQAEELLTTSWSLIHSPDVPASVKEKLLVDTVRWGGLEPAKSNSGIEGPAGGVNITINLAGQAPTPKVINHEG